jgi:hypothetical protein
LKKPSEHGTCCIHSISRGSNALQNNLSSTVYIHKVKYSTYKSTLSTPVCLSLSLGNAALLAGREEYHAFLLLHDLGPVQPS